jgi:secreted trypsin-like serine protease
VFGEYDISGDLESKRSVSKNVKRVIVHRQYDAATFENDLAILELESPVRYDTHIGKQFFESFILNGFVSGSDKTTDTQFLCQCNIEIHTFDDENENGTRAL